MEISLFHLVVMVSYFILLLSTIFLIYVYQMKDLSKPRHPKFLDRLFTCQLLDFALCYIGTVGYVFLHSIPGEILEPSQAFPIHPRKIMRHHQVGVSSPAGRGGGGNPSRSADIGRGDLAHWDCPIRLHQVGLVHITGVGAAVPPGLPPSSGLAGHPVAVEPVILSGSLRRGCAGCLRRCKSHITIQWRCRSTNR